MFTSLIGAVKILEKNNIFSFFQHHKIHAKQASLVKMVLPVSTTMAIIFVDVSLVTKGRTASKVDSSAVQFFKDV